MGVETARWIPWLPAVAAVLCGLCCTRRSLRVAAAPVCIASILGAFGITWMVKGGIEPGADGAVVPFFDWIQIGGFGVDFSYFIDPLTIIMLLVITGIGTLVVIYASGYMAGDRGYARFFAAVSLFIFAMTTLVMADNLVLLYLGWEGVGLCSYLLIGFYYQKPSAVAAAKKAFIVNRIGDLGFALGIMLTYLEFNTVQYAPLFELLDQQTNGASWSVQVIPFLLMLGAFGKSAQIPLYVWLPDAMEGPTPVSALIHAATMVTAGVYMIARLFPLFELSPYALPVVAVVGASTALFAATIALCQYDIKRVFAYSTISQLGYMFLGVGVASTVGGVFHLFTHAFFKALLFLTAGSVMHSLAGQLDMRKMSGLRHKMPVTCWLMFVGCLALAGFPYTAGFFSKDLILADTLSKGLTHEQPLYTLLAVVGLVTAFLTAYYTFRLWFRVFTGPQEYEMGTEHGHGSEHEPHGPTDDPQHSAGSTSRIQVEHHHDAHEVSWLMNGPLVLLAVGAVIAGFSCGHWIEEMVLGSSAEPVRVAAGHHGDHGHVTLMGMELHAAMMWISSAIAIGGIAVAAYFHRLNRAGADELATRWRGLVRVLENKYFVDEMLQSAVVGPLRVLGDLCFVFDRLVIDGVVAAVAWVPKMLGLTVQPAQRGLLQGYGIGMAAGTAVLVLMVIWAYGS